MKKPFTLSWEEAQTVIETSRAKGLFCMEAIWLRFNPLIPKCKSLISQETIGDICSLNLESGYCQELSHWRNLNKEVVQCIFLVVMDFLLLFSSLVNHKAISVKLLEMSLASILPLLSCYVILITLFL